MTERKIPEKAIKPSVLLDQCARLLEITPLLIGPDQETLEEDLRFVYAGIMARTATWDIVNGRIQKSYDVDPKITFDWEIGFSINGISLTQLLGTDGLKLISESVRSSSKKPAKESRFPRPDNPRRGRYRRK